MMLYDNDSYRDEFMNGVYALLSSDPTNDRANQIIDLFDAAPEVDAEPVRHGRYISAGVDELYCDFGDCSICGEYMPEGSKYCPYCGAKMDEDESTKMEGTLVKPEVRNEID